MTSTITSASQMNREDQSLIRALPGNSKCCDCNQPNPQWASVSLGSLFCLECSGQHRALGVHISFVRSIAMDSWTSDQLRIMKAGGNQKLQSYLTSKGGIDFNNSTISMRYDNAVAQSYKATLKHQALGTPLTDSNINVNASKLAPTPMSTNANNAGRGDVNGMERLVGETDEEYVQRQTRLRDEAKARMAAKFQNNSLNSKMTGIGSDASYRPSSGYGYGYGSTNSMEEMWSSAFGTLSSYTQSAAEFTRQTAKVAQSTLQDPNLHQSVASSASNLWGNLQKFTSDLIDPNLTNSNNNGNPYNYGNDVNDDDDDDGLLALQRQAKAHMNNNNNNKNQHEKNKYTGFGSSSFSNNNNNDVNSINQSQTMMRNTTNPHLIVTQSTNSDNNSSSNTSRGGGAIKMSSNNDNNSSDDFFASFGA